ncbi:MAG: thioesterase family protein [Crocinitomix sp.]|nr:thioesterase family protein [Crocinitomix sp.]
MYLHETKIRIRYGETDQMGYVYYGNYAQFFEIGRVEMLRALGVSYASMEKQGIMLPVIDFSVKYIKAAHYDDLITIHTMIEEIPSVKIKFIYEIYNETKLLLTSAKTTLVFVKKDNMKPTNSPQELVAALTAKLLENKR